MLPTFTPTTSLASHVGVEADRLSWFSRLAERHGFPVADRYAFDRYILDLFDVAHSIAVQAESA